MIRQVLLAAGLVVLGGLIWHIGLLQVWETVERVGFVAFCVTLTPFLVVYVLDTCGWWLTLGPWGARVGFIRLFMVRMAGESVNVTTAMLGGEPMKAWLLTRDGVPMVDGLASVVTAKTIMSLAQILFMLMGLGATLWLMEGEYTVLVAFVGLGLLGVGTVLFLILQRHGIGKGLLTVADRCGIRRLEVYRSRLLELDRTILTFYRQRRRTFMLAMGIHFVAWLMESVEVYAILSVLGVEVGWVSSLSIAAVASLIKGSVSFVPGGLGAQEGGYLVFLMALGYGEVTGVAFALLRRIREVLWLLIGLLFLAALRDRASLATTS